MTAWNPGELDTRAQFIFQGLIPDLAARGRAFSVDASEVDEELLALFRDHIRNLVPSLLQVIARQQELDIRRDAHSLLGMGGTIGIPSLSVVAEELSLGAQQGDYRRCSILAEGLQKWMEFWSEHRRIEP